MSENSVKTPVVEPQLNRRTAQIYHAFSPNKVISMSAMQIIVGFQIAGFLLLWLMSPFKILPKPMETLNALSVLWNVQGLGPALVASFVFNLKALAVSAVISLGLAYLTVIPFFRPLVNAISKGRFLSLVGFSLLFTLAVGGGSALKMSLLVFAMTVFFVTSMASVVAEIPKSEFDFARTLHMSEWRVVWEVVILGTADRALEVLRQNAAIGWMMLTMVEGLVRAEGGVGVLLLNNQKHMALAEVFAIQLTILVVGLFQDVIIGMVRRLLCPYAYITLERA